jgi:hypothetical protein
MDSPQQKPSSMNCGLFLLLGIKSLVFENTFNERNITPRKNIRGYIGEELIGGKLK